MKIAVVTDSTAFLKEETKQKDNLFIIPIPVILDNQILNEGIDVTADGYYDLLKKSQTFPTTSQPAMGEVLSLYEELAEKGYEAVISIHLSSGISGFIRNLTTLAPTIEEIKVYPFDSLITSSPMGNMIEIALDMIGAGEEIEQILEKLTVVRENSNAYLIVDDLNNLVRGGRLTNGAALIGSLLQIKPILTFEEGKIVVFEKIRSSKKAFQRAIRLLGEQKAKATVPLKFYVIHANNLTVAEQLKQEIEAEFPDIDIEISYFGPVIGTHLGEKAIGLGWSAC